MVRQRATTTGVLLSWYTRRRGAQRRCARLEEQMAVRGGSGPAKAVAPCRCQRCWAAVASRQGSVGRRMALGSGLTDWSVKSEALALGDQHR